MRKCCFLFFMVLFHCLCNGQEITYDTTYQVTYENGIKDSVIIITKKVLISEQVYIIDSISKNKWSYDFFICPVNFNLFSPSRKFSSSELSNTNKLSSQIGQAIGSQLYYKVNDKWEFRAGMQLSRSRLNVKSNRVMNKSVTTTFFVNDTLDIYYSINDFGDTLYYYIIEPLETSETNTVFINQTSKSSMIIYFLQMSLQAGYRKSVNKWNFYLLGGPVIDFLIRANGNGFDNKGERISVQDNSIVSPTINAQFNFQAAYALTEKYQLYAEPYFQKYLFSTNNNNSWVNKNDILGIRMGMKFFL